MTGTENPDQANLNNQSVVLSIHLPFVQRVNIEYKKYMYLIHEPHLPSKTMLQKKESISKELKNY